MADESVDEPDGTTQQQAEQTSDQQPDPKAGQRAARAEHKAEQKAARDEARAERKQKAGAAVANVRNRVAQVVWIICVVAALFLAVGALCIALKANPANDLVKFVEDTADKLDLGVFSRGKSGVAHFKGHTHAAMTKNALVNWGLAAVVWLIGGRILDRIIRP
jgi:hypothetical protein